MYEGKLVNFTIEDNCYVDDTFIGSTVAKKITVNILNPDNEIDLENKTIEAYVGIELNGKMEEIPYGSYIIEKPDNEEVQEKTSFTGYDYMIKFNAPYVHDDSIVYPIKLNELLEKLCNQVGLELGSSDFTNSDYMVQGNPFTNNEDCRTVLSNIAQLAGGFAKIGRDNKVYIKSLKNLPGLLRVKDVHNMPVKDLNLVTVDMLSNYKENSDDNIDKNNYFEDFSKNNEWGEVNSLVLKISDIEGENTAREDKESIEENGLTEITIEDNYFLINEEERNKVIEPLWEHLRGIRYLPFKTKYYGYPYLDTGDMLAVVDTKNNEYFSYVFNHTFTYNGAFDGNLDTPAMTKTQIAYKNTNDLKNKFRRVEIAVDKANGRITSVVERQDEQENEFNTKLEQTETNILETVEANIDGLDERLTASLELKLNTDDLISEINASADKITLTAGRLIINSGNFQLDANGNIIASSGTIGGFTLNSTSFSSNLNGIYNYNIYDLRIIQFYIMMAINLPYSMQEALDVIDDNILDSKDYMKIKAILQGSQVNTKNMTGTIKINSKDPKNSIAVFCNGELCAGMGVGGINSSIITTPLLLCSDTNNVNADLSGIIINGIAHRMEFSYQGNSSRLYY